MLMYKNAISMTAARSVWLSVVTRILCLWSLLNRGVIAVNTDDTYLNPSTTQAVSDSLQLTSTRDVECTRRCLMTDTTPDCWQQSVDYFTAQVQRSVRDYAAILVLMNRWRATSTNTVFSSNVTDLEQHAIDGVLQDFADLDEEQREPLSPEDLESVFKVLLNKTSAHFSHYADPETIPPGASCPVSCDYYPAVWAKFSYVLISCLFLLCSTFFLYTCYTSKRIDKLGRL